MIFGNVAQPADSANIARVIALRAGVPISTPASTVHRNCASGMEAITTAFDRIRFGYCDLVSACGVESMSGIPFLYQDATRGKFVRMARARSVFGRLAALASFRVGDFKPVIGIEEGLTDPFCGLNMGDTAENLAREFAISRRDRMSLHFRATSVPVSPGPPGFSPRRLFPFMQARSLRLFAKMLVHARGSP